MGAVSKRLSEWCPASRYAFELADPAKWPLTKTAPGAKASKQRFEEPGRGFG